MSLDIQHVNATMASYIRKSSLPQTIRMVGFYLHQAYPHLDKGHLYEKIVFSSNPSLAFPKSEIHEVYFTSDTQGIKANIVLNFLGLFGSSSPLPTHYSESVLQDSDNENILRNFLDMFNHHLQKFIYPIWERSRYYIQYQHDLQDRFSKYMLSILGLYSQTQQRTASLDFTRLLPYVNLLNMRQRSAASLVSIIRHYLAHDTIDIQQCIVSDEMIPSFQLTQLGKANNQLGESALLGESVKDHTGKFRIVISGIAWEQLYDFSVLGEKIHALKALINFAQKEPLKYDVLLRVDKSQSRAICLESQKENGAQLGINSWLGEALLDEEILFQP